MPSWWGKSSSKEVKKKPNRESIIETLQRKLKNASEEKCDNNSGRLRYHDVAISKKGSGSLTPSRSPSPSAHVSRCQSFSERPSSQPLPLPGSHLPAASDANSSIILSSKLERAIGSKPSLRFPLPKPGYVYAEGDIGTASVSSDSSVDSGNSFDSPHIASPLAFDYQNGKRTNISSSFSKVHKNQPLTTIQRNSRASSRPSPQLCNNKLLSTSPKRGHLHLQIARPGGLCSAPDSSMSSPSRSPMRAFDPEKMLKSGLPTGKLYSDIASGYCSSLVSGHNSGHIPVGGDLSGQMFWPQNRCSPECSPIPSPRMTSPGPSSRIQSGTVTPLHPQAGGTAAEAPTKRPDDVKQQTHQLSIRPITVTNPYPFSPTFSASTTPSAPRSPSTSENPTSPGPRWQKGQLLGRGTYGHVYLGFNRESGEMCAMKEVTLFQDDARSRESAQQLGQEIALLSGLQHPNIVQYYGSETVDDKLYVYLEYVSGGSIYKLVGEYGQLGEIAIRNYTRQILLGLAYLHAKNTVHRDIKGANILVDPSGRIKLADFGMAKHITGPSCPFSFKGSPYWMAPEVIKNSDGCNLAVDIWSLGCTVLEMATTKPPWSQYEGVAAMFKIGNSKELPTIPDHLSEDGKDFVLLCLQRNPLNRPSAAQLLEHPFVKNAMLERSILSALPSEAPPAIINAVKSLGIGPAKHNLCLDSEAAGIYPLKSLRTGFGSSDVRTSRNISCPVSPTRSVLFSYKSSHTSGMTSPSPISSPHTASGSSSPLTSGGGAIPFHQTDSHDVMGMIHKSRNDFNSNGNPAYQGYKHEYYGRNFQTTHAFRDVVSSDNDAIPISRPHNVSGSSSPLTSGGGAIPFHQANCHDVMGMIHKSQNDFYSNGNTAYQGYNKHEQCGRNFQTTHACRDVVSTDNDALPMTSTVSGSSSPLTSGGAIPFHQTNSRDVMSMILKSQNDIYSNGNTAYQGYNKHECGRNFQTTHACRDVVSSDNDGFQISNTATGSFPLTSGGGAIPFHQTNSHDIMGMIHKSRNDFYSNGNTAYQGYNKHEQCGRNFQTTRACRGVVSTDNDVLPISSTVSGSSSPLTTGGGAIPFHQTTSRDVMGMIHKSRNDFYSNGNTAYEGYDKHEQYERNFQSTHACRGVVSSDNDALPNHTMRIVQGDPMEIRDGKSYLADCVSHQLLRDYVRLNACMEDAPKRDRFNGL
ncbi:hypothetical protein Fmac_004029 [Flemingia macrophylla]|uniref:mitogen-activated protein kinase kinase kinase n=1 Tax=Flemingia macrophylla TaxID=520843 RepID=A0ABD1N3T7_9FABA